MLSLRYQAQGYVVIYDRHFLFDTAPEVVDSKVRKGRPVDRVEHWLLRQLYPKPDLVIFLDAPAEVLHERKGESTVKQLDRRRGAVLELSREMPNFVQIDATQPLELVVGEVIQHIEEFSASKKRQSIRVSGRAG
jgi:thymidylate kinase